MTTTPAMPEPFAWAWRNKVTGAKGVYFEDPKQSGITSHPDYEWTNLYTEAQPIATLQAQPAEVSDEGLLTAYNSIDPCNESPTDRLIRRLRAILALRPQAVPLTAASRAVIMATRTADGDADEWPEPWAYRRGWNDAEEHHHIRPNAEAK